MKFKKLLGGGLLATVLALGVGAGLAVHSESKEADAADPVNTTIYVAVPNSKLVDSRRVKLNVNFKGDGDDWSTDDWGYMTKISDDPSYPDYSIYTLNFTDKYGGLGAIQFQIRSSLGAWIEQDQAFGDKVWTSASVYNGCITTYDSEASNTWTQYTPTVPTYTVSEYAVVNGVVESDPFYQAKDIVEGTEFDVPSNPEKSGYHFVAWYTTAACTTLYTKTAVNSNMSIYAKFVDLSKDSYIYYLEDNATSNNIFTWGGEHEFGSDGSQGSAITSVSTEVHGVLNFEGRTQYIYKIKFSSEAADTTLKFHYNNWEGKTQEMQLVAGAAYWWNESADVHNTDAGAAIDLLLKIEKARNSSQYKGLNYSVCGIDKDVAEDLIDEYDNTLTDEGREFVDGTYTKTYDPSKSASESPSEVQVKYSLIIAKLREIASGNGPSANTKGISLFGDIDNSTPIMLVVIISVVSLTAVGGYIFLKRRKEN